MAFLIAQGQAAVSVWRKELVEGERIVVGREAGEWSAPWDDLISRKHVEAIWKEGSLEVAQLPEARNPVFVRGRKRARFSIEPGGHFVIGSTRFIVVDEGIETVDSHRPVNEKTYSSGELRKSRFRQSDRRMAVLSRLPELISEATDEQALLSRVVNVLMAGVLEATAAALVRCDDATQPDSPIHVLHWDRRATNTRDFRPSRRLIRQAVSSGDSVVHVWAADAQTRQQYTTTEDADWSFCVPVEGKASPGWAIYVSGSFVNLDARDFDHERLRDDLKFSELVATTLGSLRDVKMLQRRSAGLSQFFSPVVTETLAGKDPDEVLAPREADVAVLFCDLRGFTRKSEEQQNNLLELLERVSRALGVMTHCILEEGGVVGDFHGDAAMGFWGWPLEQENSVACACRAALKIQSAFTDASLREDHPLRDFRMGVGLAFGRAVAGKIGTVDQVKVTVFGPVVNLASRLESMTKKFRAPILLDQAAADMARKTLPAEIGRLRRVAVVRPYGMKAAVEVSELLPPEEESSMSNEHVAAYEKALAALNEGDWADAFSLLHHVPAEDRVKDFLTVLIAQHNRTAPDNWNGVIELEGK